MLVPTLESTSNHRGDSRWKHGHLKRSQRPANISDADDGSKDPYQLGLQSIMQDCTVSVPPLADIDIGTVSRVLYGDYSIAGKQLKPVVQAASVASCALCNTCLNSSHFSSLACALQMLRGVCNPAKQRLKHEVCCLCKLHQVQIHLSNQAYNETVLGVKSIFLLSSFSVMTSAVVSAR